MTHSLSSNLNAQEWSEQVIVLGRGIPSWSHRHQCLSYCIAGIGEVSGWLRLYPLRFKSKDERISNFDIIRAHIRDQHPEGHRPESRKVSLYPLIEKVDHITSETTRINILEEYVDTGEFLHDNSWNGVKTLGLIQPVYPEFEIRGNKVVVRYKCGVPTCKGHTDNISPYTMEGYQIAEQVYTQPKALEKELLFLERQVLLQRQQLWFVMGTHNLHPSRWILIEVHITNEKEGVNKND